MSPNPRVRVAVVALDPTGERLLLVEHEKAEHRYWLLPGGGVEVGETMAEAAVRELAEETGLAVDVGRLLLICEVIDGSARHIINLVFAAAVTGGELVVGRDGVVSDVRWHPWTALRELEFYPGIVDHLDACRQEGFSGPVRMLGNVWRPMR